MTKKKNQQDVLTELLSASPPETLRNLVLRLAASRPEVRRECFTYLKKRVPLSNKQKKNSEGEAILSLWAELSPDLDELDEYGGGDYSLVDHVGGLLFEIQKKLDGKDVPAEYRYDLIDNLLPYIESSNAGLDDELYGVAYATCYNDDDWRSLAEALENMQDKWKVGCARSIYREIGDREKYLELRQMHMEYGADYHDLATFYWEAGEKEKAVTVAEKGLKQGTGRMDELRAFLAENAKNTGNREQYLTLQFDQTVDHLTLDKYKAFKKICSSAEWKLYETKILEKMDAAWVSEQLKIYMHRKEYKQAVGILAEEKYPTHSWDGTEELKAAKKLESRFPEMILKYYLSGLGNLNMNATRKEYARKAKVMAKVRHMYVDIMNNDEQWQAFASKVKNSNIRRPAFQEEFSRAVPGWNNIP